jgi:hypothetical protein
MICVNHGENGEKTLFTVLGMAAISINKNNPIYPLPGEQGKE